MPLGPAIRIIWDVVKNFGLFLFHFLRIFYTQFLPFIVIYIGIPLFVIGVLLALSFSGGLVLIITGFAIGLWFLVQYGILNPDPYAAKSSGLANTTTNQKIFKSNF